MLINRDNFIIKDIPKLHPLTAEYIDFWRGERKKCIEGVWNSGFYMPGNLYFYVNYWHILLNKNINSKTKTLDRPWLRDIEWEMAQGWIRARGLSGWEGMQNLSDLQVIDILENGSPNHLSLGKPLYNNEARDLMIMGSRGSGKSFYVAGAIVAHEWLFDGQKEYKLPTDEDFQKTFLQAYIEESNDKSVTPRLKAYILSNYLFDVTWSLGRLYKLSQGKSLIKVSEEKYQEMYEKRLMNLKTYIESQ